MTTFVVPKLIESIRKLVKKQSIPNTSESNCSTQKNSIVSVFDSDYLDYIPDETVIYYIDFISNGHILTCLKGITDWNIDNMTHRIIGHPKAIYYYFKEISNLRIIAAFNKSYETGIHVIDYQKNIITGEILIPEMDFEIQQIMEIPNNRLAVKALGRLRIINLNDNSILETFLRNRFTQFIMPNENKLLLSNLNYIDLLKLEMIKRDLCNETYYSFVHWKDDLYYLATEETIVLFQENINKKTVEWKMNYQKENRQPKDFLINKIELIDENTLVVILNMDLLIFTLPNFSNYISKSLDIFPLYGSGFNNIKCFSTFYLIDSKDNYLLCDKDFNPIDIHYNKYSNGVVEINKELLSISITSDDKTVFISSFPNSTTIKYTFTSEKKITHIHPLNTGNLLICLYDLCVKLWDYTERTFIKQTYCPFSFDLIEYTPPEEYRDQNAKLIKFDVSYSSIPELYHFSYVKELNDDYIVLGTMQFMALFNLKKWKFINGIQNSFRQSEIAKIDDSSFAIFALNSIIIYSIPDLKEINKIHIEKKTKHYNVSAIIFNKHLQILVISLDTDIITAYKLDGTKIWTLNEEYSRLLEFNYNTIIMKNCRINIFLNLNDLSKKYVNGTLYRCKESYKVQKINNAIIGFNKGYVSLLKVGN